MAHGDESDHTHGERPGETAQETRPQHGGEAATTRFGMEDGDNTDVPATGLDPDQQSGGAERPAPGAAPDNHTPDGEAEAAKLGDFA